MTDSDAAPTQEFALDTDSGDTPEGHLISYALTIIENAPRCLIGQEPVGEIHGERAEWLAARDKWRSQFQAWVAHESDRRSQPETMADPEPLPDDPTEPPLPMLEPHVTPLTENERLIMHARVTATATGSPVRVVRRSLFGGSIDVQVGGFQLRADGAK
jgi:hypothetical protein